MTFSTSSAVLLLTLAQADPHAGGGIALVGDLVLNGIFDVAYERAGYSDDMSAGTDVLRSYHHFVFLSRRSADDPFFFTAELIDLHFYEAGARVTPDDWPVSGAVRAGKVLVPFGNDPLFHSQYGGLQGFDQQILPVVWSQHGVVAELKGAWNDLAVQNELYVVQGFGLTAAEDVLDLQTDFSSTSDVTFGVGDRVGVSFGPVRGWYSLYANALGFGRTLFLQALDLEVWRALDVPVLRDLSLAIGLLRADVSGGEDGGYGGEPGEDYFHFGDYLELRYMPFEWLGAYARSGLRTTNNRRGLYFDDTRQDAEDGSAHALGVSLRYAGFAVDLSHTWRLEKHDEQDDDFFRMRVSYAF